MKTDILIIGAGASGLMAARQLARAGKKVIVLEARNRIGGRIHTVYNIPFSTHAELGAEFIHGELPVTQQLLKEAGIKYSNTEGEMWRGNNGRLTHEDHFIKDWDVFEEKLKALETDMSINEFLSIHFNGAEYNDLKDSVRRYAAGYDTADPDDASAFALREEWLEEAHAEQYKLKTGYQAVVKYLADDCTQAGGAIHLCAIVKEIRWREGVAEVTTKDDVLYQAGKVIITVPLNILKLEAWEENAITFTPAIPHKITAARQMGMGAIIKILLQFNTAFWTSPEITMRAEKDMSKMLFLFSNEAIPTWWTQQPDKTSLLTGWFGGPEAQKLKDTSDADILSLALQSLSNIFQLSVDYLQSILAAHVIANWTADPFTQGSYTYVTVATPGARTILSTPEAGTLYFAGEAFYEGPEMGTVEAALASGLKVADEISNG